MFIVVSWIFGIRGPMLFQGSLEVSLDTLGWYRSSHGTDFDMSEMARPVGCPTFQADMWDLNLCGRVRHRNKLRHTGPTEPGAV